MGELRGDSTCFDAVVVGAGFGGLYALHRLRDAGLRVKVFERGSSVGGTWFWNRYPGARCDIESVDYSYSIGEIEQDWDWRQRFASQPEILAYLEHVADRLDLRRDIAFETTVTKMRFDEAAAAWEVTADDGTTCTARFCIMATGSLSSANRPPIDGLEDFEGEVVYTSAWPHEGVDLVGRRVGVVGTGSTGVQLIPAVAPEVEHLHVFQRTPHFSVPAGNRPMDADWFAELKRDYDSRRRLARESGSGIPATHPDVTPARGTFDVSPEERLATYETGWDEGGAFGVLFAFNDTYLDVEANATAAEFVRDKIRGVVADPVTADALCPTDYPIGAKRICLDTNYYETYNRDNVSLVDIRKNPIEAATRHGLRTRGHEYEFDVLIFATGFDAMTGAMLAIDIEGAGGVSLRDHWADGPRTYLGLGVVGFPNLFIVAGPGSPSVLTNMVTSIEQHVDWIVECVEHMGEAGIATIEPQHDAEEEWVRHVDEVGKATIYPLADSWYMGANIPGKPRLFMPYAGGVGNYRRICEEAAADGYRGFVLSGAPQAAGSRS
jgi:cyclohexanone monooxygenase